MSFSKLPNETLVLVFSRLVLQQRIPLRIVCTRWKSNIEEMCAPQKSLILFSNLPMHITSVINGRYQHLKHLQLKLFGQDDDLLVKKQMNEEQCHMLGALFPKLERLVLELDWSYTSHFLIPASVAYCLLNEWRGLVGLSLYANVGGFLCNHDCEVRLIHNMCGVINGMRSLKQLDFFYDSANKEAYAGRLDLSHHLRDVLPRLEVFNVYRHAESIEGQDRLVSLISKLDATKCRSVWFCAFADEYERILRANPQLANITQLGIELCSDRSPQKVPSLFDQFQQLEWLFLSVGERDTKLALDQGLLKTIAKLTRLVTLTIRILQIDNKQLPVICREIGDGLLKPNSVLKSLSLRQVSPLTLVDNNNNNNNGEEWCRTLAAAFPNLTQLTLQIRPTSSRYRNGVLVEELKQNVNSFAHLEKWRIYMNDTGASHRGRHDADLWKLKLEW